MPRENARLAIPKRAKAKITCHLERKPVPPPHKNTRTLLRSMDSRARTLTVVVLSHGVLALKAFHERRIVPRAPADHPKLSAKFTAFMKFGFMKFVESLQENFIDVGGIFLDGCPELTV